MSSSFTRRLRWLFRRKRLEAEMEEEMRFHLQMRAEDIVEDGLSLEDTRYAAQRKFGNITQLQEHGREAFGWLWLEQFVQDSRYALRSWLKFPGFTLIAVLSLALGIGATAAVFSLVDKDLVETLPVKKAAELVLFEWMSGPKGGVPRAVEPDMSGPNFAFSQRCFDNLRQEGAPLVDIFASASMWGVNISADNRSEIVAFGELVSGNFYRVLGVSSMLGRTISPDDDHVGAEPVAVISYRYWQKRFGGDPGVVGKVIKVNHVSVTIIGVTQPSFLGTNPNGLGADIALPISTAKLFRRNPVFAPDPRNSWWLRLLGRVRPGVAPDQVQAKLQEVFQANARDDFSPARTGKDAPLLRVLPGGKAKTGPERDSDVRLLATMMGMASLVLVAACANVAALQLARGVSRRHEIAVRLALGSSRARLIRQLLTENVALALLGACVGLVVAHWNLHLLANLFRGDMKEWLRSLGVNWRVLGFTTTLSVIVGIGSGLVPALRATRPNLYNEFQGGPRSLGGRSVSRLSQILVAAQVAFCVILLVCSGLFMRTVINLNRTNLGFSPANVLLFSIDGYGAGYRPEQFPVLHGSILERIRTLPSVKSATLSNFPWMTARDSQHVPISLTEASGALKIIPAVLSNSVDSSFFETYEMPIVYGRGFNVHDTALSPKVAIVNQTLVRQFFNNISPVGKHIFLKGECEIVGVVRDAKQTGNELRSATAPMAFIPFSQDVSGTAFYAVRTSSSPAAAQEEVRSAVRSVDPDVPIFMIDTQQERIDGFLLKEKMFSSVAGYLGLIALTLTYAGLYGLISYAVARRTPELGLRMALGGSPRGVIKMILRTSISIVVVGLLIGFPAAWATTQTFSSMLFGLPPNDLLTYGIVAAFILCVTFVAGGIPARHAAKVDPMVALRAD